MKKHKLARYNFTLLEVMVSMALLGILLSFFFALFTQTLTTKNETCALKEKVRHLELFELRLHHLFDHFNEEGQCFLTNFSHADAMGSALFIHCDHGIDPEPSFSGPIHSMLFKTRDEKVCLCSWSKNHKSKVDVLLSSVKELSFEFFNGTQWHTLWPKEKKDRAFPYLVKISVLLKGDERQDFIYALPPSAEIKYSI